MNYILYGILAVLIFFILINYLRKLQWDVIHNNLFDLVDDLGGEVYRKRFLIRPVYHGKYKGTEVTINFSQEKNKAGRKTYINISLNKKLKKSVTIVSMDWLKLQKNKMEDLKIYEISSGIKYGIRSVDESRTQKKEFDSKIIAGLKKLHPINYIFMGKTGVILEKESQNISLDTKHPGLKNLIEITNDLCQDIK